MSYDLKKVRLPFLSNSIILGMLIFFYFSGCSKIEAYYMLSILC